MKLIQLNIWFGKLVSNAVAFLERENPDILCLQEACEGMEFPTPMIGTIKDIQKRCGFPHVFYSPLFDFSYLGRRIAFGNAILSRRPFTKTETVWVRGAYEEGYDFSRAGDHGRNFQHAAVDAGGGSIVHVLNHHGHWAPRKASSEETDRQLGMMADYAGRIDGPVILAGDINLSPQERSIGLLDAKLENLCVTRKVKTTRNILAWSADEVCDYIFVNGKVRVKDFRVYDDIISDHAALGLEFEAA